MSEILVSHEPVHAFAEENFAKLRGTFPEASRAELYEQVALGVFKAHFLAFHENARATDRSKDKRWDIYAEGGYRLGVETNIPHQETQLAAIKALELEDTSRLLICGAGPGPLEHHLMEEGILVEAITGLDGSELMVRMYEERFRDKANIVVAQADLNAPLPVEAKGHDRVAIVNTLEFLQADKFLAHLHGVLETGAKGVIVTPKADMKNYLPAMRLHLEKKNIDLGDSFWSNIDAQLTELYSFIFTERAGRVKVLNPDALKDPRVWAYLEKFSVVIAHIADSVSADDDLNMTPEAQQVLTMGLANAVPPAVVAFRSNEDLYELISAAGFEVEPIKDWNSVNADLSRLIKFRKH